MPSCAVKWCVSRSENHNKKVGVTFHVFPADPIRKNKWITAVKLERQQNDWMPVKTSRVCSVHFDENDFYKSLKGYTKLHKAAVPVCTMIRPEKTSTSFRDTTTVNGKINYSERLQLLDFEETMPHTTLVPGPPILVPIATTHHHHNEPQDVNSTLPTDLLAPAALAPATTHHYPNELLQDIKPTLQLPIYTSNQLECQLESEIIIKLKNKLERVKKVSQQRLGKIKNLTKRISRLKNKNNRLHVLLKQILKEDKVQVDIDNIKMS